MANNAAIVKYYDNLDKNKKLEFIKMLMDYDYDWYENEIENVIWELDDKDVDLEEDYDVIKEMSKK